MVKDVIDFKIKYCDDLIGEERKAQVRLEVLILNEEIAVKELPDNPAKVKALEEMEARLSRYHQELKEREKSIEILEEQKKRYEKMKS